MTDAKTEYYIGLGKQRTIEAEKKASDRALRDILSQKSSTENKPDYNTVIERQIGDLYTSLEAARADAAEYLDRCGPSSSGTSSPTYNPQEKPKSNSPKKKPGTKTPKTK